MVIVACPRQLHQLLHQLLIILLHGCLSGIYQWAGNTVKSHAYRVPEAASRLRRSAYEGL